MGQVTTTAPAVRSLAALWRPKAPGRVLSEALYYAQRAETHGIPVPDHVLSPAAIEEARVAILEYDLACQAAGVPLIVRWLFEINAAVNAPLEPADFQVRSRAVAAACADLPACLFTAETRTEAARTFRFFPGGADLAAFMAPRRATVERTRRALRRIADPPGEAPPSARPASMEEVERIVAEFRMKMREAKAAARSPTEQADRIGPQPSRLSRPAPLSRGALMASYRAVADNPREAPGARERARFRLRMLEAAEARETSVSPSHAGETSHGRGADGR